MTDNFDYRKPRIQIEELFPDIFKSDINVSVLNNAENRLFTKPDTIHVSGSIGRKNPSIPNTNRVVENSPHRQAWQLQPLLYSKIATVDHITAYYDILNKLKHLGVDINSLPKWGNTLQFNYAPPINIDKLTNYSNYYWYDVNSNSQPQYITIENQFNTVNSKIIELRRYYNEKVSTGTPTAELKLIQNTIIQYFTLQQQLRNKHVGFDVMLWDDNGGDWDPLSDWITAGIDNTHHVIPVIAPQGVTEWDTDNTDMLNLWSLENMWVHESDLPHTAVGIQATMPIIEYNANLEINEWTFTKHNWLYRKNLTSDWISVDVEPTVNEINIRCNIVDISIDSKYILLPLSTGDNIFVIAGDKTALFVNGYRFVISATHINDGVKITQQSRLSTNGLYTLVYVNEPVFIEPARVPLVVPYNSKEYLGYDVKFGVILQLTTTSLGDSWCGCFVHWMWNGTNAVVPVNHQLPNIHQQRYITIITFDGFDVGPFDTGLEQERSTDGMFIVENTIVNPQTIHPITHVVTINNITMYLNNSVYYSTYAEVPIDISSDVNTFNYLYGLDDLQVYVNGIRQYGTYEEFKTNSIYANAILFFNKLKSGDIVQMRSGAACSLDVGREIIWVQDDQNNITQRSLIRYKKHEQVKSQHTQYPLFDIYNVDKTTAYQANCIFKYQELVTNLVDSRVNMRITMLDKERNYIFQQLLLNADTEEMYCYKNYDTVSTDNPEGLQTIWQKGINNEEYVPRYVNEYRLADGDTYLDPTGNTHTTILPIDDPTGAWEIPDQLYFNAQHENRATVSYIELYKHFTTIINNQPIPKFTFGNTQVPFNFIIQQDQFKLLDAINYYEGGTIKEHNGCYDTFLSTLYQELITTPTLIKYALKQYENNILLIKEMFIKNLPEIISNTSPSAIVNLQQYIINHIILNIQSNDNLTYVFSDTTAYDANTNTGMPNWIVTLPILQLTASHEPQLLIDNKLGLYHIIHHDGHFSNNKFTDTDIKYIITRILKKNGTSGTGAKPNLNGLTNGVFWYDKNTKQLWKYTVIAIQSTVPSISTPIGVYWYNNITDTLYVRANTTTFGWDIEPNHIRAWQLVDINLIISKTLLTIEQKLYSKCENITSLKIDYSNIYHTDEEATKYISYLHDEYIKYTKEHNLNIFYTDFNISNAWTWNYTEFPNLPSITVNRPNISNKWGSRWYTIYTELYGTPYPHLEPWKLQGYTKKPTNWDHLYANTSNGGRWSSVMWENIKIGNIVGVEPQLTSIIPVYNNRLSVNISGITIGNYAPDDLLPPHVSDAILQQYTITSYGSFTPAIQNAISANYAFGQQGPTERLWRESSNYRYSILIATFRMQPIRFIQQTFGFEFYEINKLQIEKQTKKVVSHKDVVFHGMVINGTTQTRSINGLNQWYINAIRSKGYDIYISDFIIMWKDWDLKITYQTDSVINSKSLSVNTDFYQIENQDYTTYMKKSSGAFNNWLNSIIVSLYKTGTVAHSNTHIQIPSDTGSDWQFRLDVPINPGADLNVYDVNVYNIVSVNDITNEITIHKTSPWIDGTQIYINSNIKTIKYGAPYFIISETPTTFKLASGYVDGVARNNDILVYDTLKHTITLNGDVSPTNPRDLDLWSYTNTNTGLQTFKQYHKLSKTWQLYSSSSHIFRMHNDTRADNLKMYYNDILLIENTDYVIFPNGWVQVLNGLNFNPTQPTLTVRLLLTTNIQIYEQYNTFYSLNRANCNINWTHYAVNKSRVLSISFPTIITGVQNVINFIDGYSAYLKDQGFVFNDYYRTSIDTETGLLISWQTEIEKFIDKAWRGFNTKFDTKTQQLIKVYDSYEINPFKYDIWITPRLGIISNIISGPFVDILTQPIVYDQYGVPILTIDNLKIFREDNLTYIVYPKPETVPFEKTFLHIGGMHLFSDVYEHVVAFNNYTIDGKLVYDPYIGLNISKIHTSFDKHYERTCRPNLGGYFLHDGKMIENIEASASHLQKYYDVYTADETANHIEYARKLLGYVEPKYLDLLGSTEKSKFIFWRGMIQHKGSNAAITAFSNSRSLLDANIDEFWTYKLAQFGDNRTKLKPTIHVFLSDVVRNTIMYQFMNVIDNTPVFNGFDVESFDTGLEQERSTDSTSVEEYFTKITNIDVDRWVDLPDANYLIDTSMYFDAEVTDVITFTSTDITTSIATRGSIRTSQYNIVNNNHQYLKTSTVCDGVQIFVDNGVQLVADIHYMTSTIILNAPIITNMVRVIIRSPQLIVDTTLNEEDTIIQIIGQYHNSQGVLSIFVTNTANIKSQILDFTSVIRDDNTLLIIHTKFTNDDLFTVYIDKILNIVPNNTNSNRIVLQDPYVTDNGALIIFVNDIKVSATIESIIHLPYHYITRTNNLKVYVDGHVNNSYTELTNNSILLSSTPNTTITVLYQQGQLIEYNDNNLNGHYKKLSSSLIEFLIDITDISIIKLLTVFLINPAKSKLNDCKLIDSKSNVVTKELPIWDPIRGIYPTNVDLMVDYYSTTNPAQYDNSTTPGANAWNMNEVGKIWMDTSKLGYVPYIDPQLYPTIIDRMFAWGNVPKWSSVELYEWVSSPVVPERWIDLVTDDINNTLVEEKNRYTGDVHTQLYYRTRADITSNWGDWIITIDTHQIFNGYDYNIINNSITVTISELTINTITDNYDVFVNEQETTSFTVVQNTNNIITLITVTGINISSIIRVVKYADIPTQEMIDDISTDPTTLIQYNLVHPYTFTFVYDESGHNWVYTYFFWVKNRTNRVKNNLAIIDIKHIFKTPQQPYVFYQHLLYDNGVLPNRYDQCIINNITYDINEEGRYDIQFTKDFTLRDQLEKSGAILKNKYNEWKMFREKDLSSVPRRLWDKITETLLGYKITDPTHLIPSLNRILFDSVNNTTTCYGFNIDQAVGPKNIIFDTVIALLEDSNYDFQPINKENFLENYTFMTPENIIAGMDYIYTYFPCNIVNRIFFNILNDTLTYNHELTGIFKTSMVALNCTLTFETASSVIDV